MNRLGVTEDSYESFMSDIYKRCNNLGLTPESIAYYLTNLIEFSKTVPLCQISEYIQQKIDEKMKLEEEIQKLKDQIKILNEEKSSSELRRTSALNEENMTTVELKSYSVLLILFRWYMQRKAKVSILKDIQSDTMSARQTHKIQALIKWPWI